MLLGSGADSKSGSILDDRFHLEIQRWADSLPCETVEHPVERPLGRRASRCRFGRPGDLEPGLDQRRHVDRGDDRNIVVRRLPRLHRRGDDSPDGADPAVGGELLPAVRPEDLARLQQVDPRPVARALALAQVLSSLLIGISGYDVTTFVIVPAMLVAVALVACYLPARRATKVDPLVALRYE